MAQHLFEYHLIYVGCVESPFRESGAVFPS